MSSGLREVYRSAEKDFEILGHQTKWRCVIHTWMARLVGGCHPFYRDSYKIDKLVNLLEGPLSECGPIVIWFAYRSELDTVGARIENRWYTSRVWGKQSVKDRRLQLDNWNSSENGVLLAQVHSVKFGMDFSHADTSIYFSNPWSAEARTQSEDRIVHPRKDKPLLYIDLITRDSLDEDVLKALRNKKKRDIRGLITLNFRNRLKCT